MFFWNSCFFDDIGNLISGFPAFSKSSLYIWKFSVHILLKPNLKNFEHYLASMWMSTIYSVVWTFFAIAFLGIGIKTDLFSSCGHCWVFQTCWHIECGTFTASSFRIWNSSAGIPSPPLRDPRAYWSPGNPKAAPPAPWAPSSDLQVGLWDLQRSEGPAFPPFLNPRDREVLTGGAAPGPRVQPSSGSHEGVAPTSPCPGVKRAAKRAGTGAVGVGGRCPMVLPTLSLPPGTLPPWDAPSHY